MAFAAMVRSPHAHARIKSIDTARPRAPRPACIAVFTGADFVADGRKPIPHQAVDGRRARRRAAGAARLQGLHRVRIATLADRQGALRRRAGRDGRRRVARRGEGRGGTGRGRVRAAAGGRAWRPTRCEPGAPLVWDDVRRQSRASMPRSATRRRPMRPSRARRMSCASRPGSSASPACRWSRAPRSAITTRRPGATRIYAGTGGGVVRERQILASVLGVPRGAMPRACAATWAAISARATSSFPNTACCPGRRNASAGR